VDYEVKKDVETFGGSSDWRNEHPRWLEEWMFDATENKIKIEYNPKLQQPFSRDMK